MSDHGGRLWAACQHHGGTPADWLDLSTGIAPWSYPLPAVPERVWQRLPEPEDGLLPVAAHFYGCQPQQLLAVPGSQWAIEQIPLLYPAGLKVAMLAHGYSEHPRAWQAAGHTVILSDTPQALLANASHCDAAVWIQPHNPLGHCLSDEQLTQLHQRLRQQILVVDEAFADSRTPSQLPLLPHCWRLKSIGKFFGLAGIRLGFVLADSTLLERLNGQLSPWAVSHPARWAARLALPDTAWQAQQRQRLQEQSTRLQQLLQRTGLTLLAQTDLFVTITHPQAAKLHHHASQQQLLLRHFPDLCALRFGLPHSEGDWLRLERWLAQVYV